VTEDLVPIRATTADRDRVVETVVAAFAADPAFRFFFPDKDRYVEQATVFARYLFDKRVAMGTVWIVEGGDAVAMWQPPTAPNGPAIDLPEDVLARIEAADHEVEKHLPATPYWYLGILATHPRAAGRRLGRTVMGAGLAKAAEAGLPAYLETTTPTNVGIYERSGWRVVAATAADTLPIWVLAHD
jgi:GNAT superfamily N-acetyltransferase